MKSVSIGIILFLFLSGCSSTIVESSLSTKKNISDGYADEWELPLRFYDSKNKLQYECTHDANNVYLCVGVNDPRTQMKMLRSGMQIQISKIGNTKTNQIIYYPLAEREMRRPIINADSALAAQSGMRKRDKRYLQTRIEHASEQFKLSGFRNLPNLTVLDAMENSTGIYGGMGLDSAGMMIYEIQIPWKVLSEITHTTNPKDNTIELTLFIQGLQENLRTNRPGDNANYSSGNYPSGGGMRPGGMGGMGSPGGMGPMGGMSRGMAGGGRAGGGRGNYNGAYGQSDNGTSPFENTKVRLKIISANP